MRYLPLYFVLFFLGTSFTKPGSYDIFVNENELDSIPYDSIKTKADSIIFFGKQFLGTPYKYGGCSPKGFDCSGFVYYIFKNNGVDIPRSSFEMGAIKPEVPLIDCEKGDIILFRGTNVNNPQIGHAAVVISEKGEELTFMHSSSNTKKGGVIISKFNESVYYTRRFVKIVRVLK
jgi:cell wall-associated NlpC family hydrolase